MEQQAVTTATVTIKSLQQQHHTSTRTARLHGDECVMVKRRYTLSATGSGVYSEKKTAHTKSGRHKSVMEQ